MVGKCAADEDEVPHAAMILRLSARRRSVAFSSARAAFSPTSEAMVTTSLRGLSIVVIPPDIGNHGDEAANVTVRDRRSRPARPSVLLAPLWPSMTMN